MVVRRNGDSRNAIGHARLSDCIARHALPREEAFYCAHPAVETPDFRVAENFCAACDLWRNVPSAGLRQPPRFKSVATWAVGLTTAPRKVPTLERTLDSLARAGWDCPRLFVEPGTEIPRRFAHLPRTQRDEPIGAFPNWYLGLAELVMRQPHAEAYFMVQDDVVFARGLREWLEFALWPAEKCGVVSVYCPSHYAVGQPPGFHIEDRGWRTWIGQTHIFPNPSARAAVAHIGMVNHRHHGPREGMRNLDCAVGLWCKQSGRPFYVISPSLAQHIGDTSTLYMTAKAAGRRSASTFIGEDSDVGSILGGSLE